MSNDKKYRKARIWSNNQLSEISHLFSGKIINVSAGDDRDKQGNTYSDYFTSAESYSISNYPKALHRGYQGLSGEIPLDLEQPLPNELHHAFDVVFNHTALEHVFNVTYAFRNLCSLSRDIVILVVPFCQVQHETDGYGDYWRFTPSCLMRLFDKEGFKVAYWTCNNEFNTSVYIFMVASKNIQKWLPLLPNESCTHLCGEWVGSSRSIASSHPHLKVPQFSRLVNLLLGLLRKMYS
jgi:hypothetical protein